MRSEGSELPAAGSQRRLSEAEKRRGVCGVRRAAHAACDAHNALTYFWREVGVQAKEG